MATRWLPFLLLCAGVVSCSALRERFGAKADAGTDAGGEITKDVTDAATTVATNESPAATSAPTARPGVVVPRRGDAGPTDAGPASSDAGKSSDAGTSSDAGARPKKPATSAAVVMASYDRDRLSSDLPKIEAAKGAIVACANQVPGIFLAGDQISVRVDYRAKTGGKAETILGWSRTESSTPVPAGIKACLEGVIAATMLSPHKVGDAGISTARFYYNLE